MIAIWPNLSPKNLDLLVTPHKCKGPSPSPPPSPSTSPLILCAHSHRPDGGEDLRCDDDHGVLPAEQSQEAAGHAGRAGGASTSIPNPSPPRGPAVSPSQLCPFPMSHQGLIPAPSSPLLPPASPSQSCPLPKSLPRPRPHVPIPSPSIPPATLFQLCPLLCHLWHPHPSPGPFPCLSSVPIPISKCPSSILSSCPQPQASLQCLHPSSVPFPGPSCVPIPSPYPHPIPDCPSSVPSLCPRVPAPYNPCHDPSPSRVPAEPDAADVPAHGAAIPHAGGDTRAGRGAPGRAGHGAVSATGPRLPLPGAEKPGGG